MYQVLYFEGDRNGGVTKYVGDGVQCNLSAPASCRLVVGADITEAHAHRLAKDNAAWFRVAEEENLLPLPPEPAPEPEPEEVVIDEKYLRSLTKDEIDDLAGDRGFATLDAKTLKRTPKGEMIANLLDLMIDPALSIPSGTPEGGD